MMQLCAVRRQRHASGTTACGTKHSMPTAAYQTVAVELVVGDAKEFPRDGLDTPVAPVQGGDVVWLATTQQ